MISIAIKPCAKERKIQILDAEDHKTFCAFEKKLVSVVPFILLFLKVLFRRKHSDKLTTN